jgi:NAD(P)-dependent dehydrogenase (short-subunit alcohol dehydrogenase family)
MKTIPFLAGKVAVVTGAGRGVGAGIATLLGEQGATVYVTGRTTASKPGTTPGTISEVADSITRAGGVGIAVVCDHADDAQIKALFERVKAEHGHLDILVNNATALGPDPYAPPPFWNKSLTISEHWFTISVRCELLCGSSFDRGRWGACGECFLLLWSRLLPPRSGLRCHQGRSR